MLDQFIFATNVTAPILILLILGIIFRRRGFIDPHFINIANSFVFNVTLPCMLFFSIASTPLAQSTNIPLLLFGVLSTLASILLFWLLSLTLIQQDKRGVFIQGAFRGNLGIIGIALVFNAYGNEMLAVASLYMALIAILDNPISVLLLQQKGEKPYRNILTNPIIIAVVAGLMFSRFAITPPFFIIETGQYLAQMTLPLALICVGGSLYWQDFQSHHKEVIWATICKLLIMPFLGTVAAIHLGFSGKELGLIYLMLSSPTAVSSYIMAKKMTEHGMLAAEIIALTTASSTLIITLGLLLLQISGYL
ncbi:AEC family transporter [Methyloprofundus sp.]|uniref:AEC family transporter n=1 Tax=Methyloprofundus sp. TaxID=2020875 RepID=UPI003D107926